EKNCSAGVRSPRNITWIQSEAYVERGISLGQILNQAIEVGWIRTKDVNWIQEELGMKVGNW
ncbi:MAG: hypothetical protein NC828_06005, partial [Candidatus Omnitrophica bacterium]|nr:hypothetical protein [Candidatus Omnitrophota bacterium]